MCRSRMYLNIDCNQRSFFSGFFIEPCYQVTVARVEVVVVTLVVTTVPDDVVDECFTDGTAGGSSLV